MYGTWCMIMIMIPVIEFYYAQIAHQHLLEEKDVCISQLQRQLETLQVL